MEVSFMRLPVAVVRRSASTLNMGTFCVGQAMPTVNSAYQGCAGLPPTGSACVLQSSFSTWHGSVFGRDSYLRHLSFAHNRHQLTVCSASSSRPPGPYLGCRDTGQSWLQVPKLSRCFAGHGRPNRPNSTMKHAVSSIIEPSLLLAGGPLCGGEELAEVIPEDALSMSQWEWGLVFVLLFTAARLFTARWHDLQAWLTAQGVDWAAGHHHKGEATSVRAPSLQNAPSALASFSEANLMEALTERMGSWSSPAAGRRSIFSDIDRDEDEILRGAGMDRSDFMFPGHRTKSRKSIGGFVKILGSDSEPQALRLEHLRAKKRILKDLMSIGVPAEEAIDMVRAADDSPSTTEHGVKGSEGSQRLLTAGGNLWRGIAGVCGRVLAWAGDAAEAQQQTGSSGDGKQFTSEQTGRRGFGVLKGGGGSGGSNGNAGEKTGASSETEPENAGVAAAAEVARKRKERFKEDLRRNIVNPEDIDVSLDKFPYYLSESARELLVNSAFVHLTRKDFARFLSGLPPGSPRILLSGPANSEIYQETVARALARHFQARLLIFDSTSTWSDDDPAGQALPDEAGTSQTLENGAVGGLQAASASGLSQEEMDMVVGQALVDVVSSAAGGVGAIFSPKDGPMALRLLSRDWPLDDMQRAKLLGGSGDSDSKRSLKRGDRVKYVGPGRSIVAGMRMPKLRSILTTDSLTKGRGSGSHSFWVGPSPQVGARGRVVVILDDNPNKVGVQFDKQWRGGALSPLTPPLDGAEDEPGQGVLFFCDVSELQMEDSSEVDFGRMAISALFDVANEEAEKGPFVLFLRDVERWVLGSQEGRFERFKALQAALEELAPGVLVLGAFAPSGVGARDKGMRSQEGMFKSGMMEHPLMASMERLLRERDMKDSNPKEPEYLRQLFPSRIQLQPPQDEPLLTKWREHLEADRATMIAEGNRQTLQALLRASQMQCPELESLHAATQLLTQRSASKVLAWAAAYNLMRVAEPELQGLQLVIAVEDLQHGLKMLEELAEESAVTSEGERKGVKDVATDNEFERMLLSDVIPPGEVGVTFDDIGALDPVKETLKELVMLPLQRPELFRKGQLTKPARGVLLFGPPGTGKTMLAKAVATEAGANFINVSVSSITSKWFGDAEKLVKAIFTLASKLAPTVIFVDEVDSLLSTRGASREHEAMRKMKNEFMACWDGLRSKAQERVLVLGATNRPFDLDDAVIRRLPRRLMVGLPDEENRAKILRVILRDEALEPGFVYEELARMTDGYSGSDLKNLCMVAAYQPVRELLEREKETGERLPGEPHLRPMTVDDFRQAKDKVGTSVSLDASSIQDLQRWNEEYGEGGSRQKRSLGFDLSPRDQLQ